jgi:hypothetical protein
VNRFPVLARQFTPDRLRIQVKDFSGSAAGRKKKNRKRKIHASAAIFWPLTQALNLLSLAR